MSDFKRRSHHSMAVLSIIKLTFIHVRFVNLFSGCVRNYTAFLAFARNTTIISGQIDSQAVVATIRATVSPCINFVLVNGDITVLSHKISPPMKTLHWFDGKIKKLNERLILTMIKQSKWIAFYF
ncbi:hypothetical protein P5G61_05805 [Paenibacillus sp. F6_3S_P_1C]|uniref:Uncharacterized protein n=1 Tax=Paenibacillus vandeheii TaxID=3035917 RepID=A0ABT8J6L7_9BACL|nr:hypothetical protein [Paenibacillus vandeheii]MDN4600732.1 hypothetical protein [Paenibacillus vandeheii]